MAWTRWTEAEEADLRDLYPHTSNPEIARILNDRHGNNRSADGVCSRAGVLGLLKNKSVEIKRTRQVWTDEKVEWFRSFVPGHTESEISAEHERIYGTPLSEGQIGNAKNRFGVKSGTVGGRFEKGQVSHNKGKTWDEMGFSPELQERIRKNTFKKGEVRDIRPGWMKPIGHERVSINGYVEVKVRDSMISGPQPKEPGKFHCNYRFKHHLVWEEANGVPVPPGHKIVFADHDKRNFDPNNLVAVPNPVWKIIGLCKIPYQDRESLETAMLMAKLAATRRKAMKELKR